MYKKLLRKSTDFELSDLAGVDAPLHDGLEKLLEYTPKEEVEDVFCRTFEVWHPPTPYTPPRTPLSYPPLLPPSQTLISSSHPLTPHLSPLVPPLLIFLSLPSH